MNDSGAESFEARWGLDRASFLARHSKPIGAATPAAGTDVQLAAESGQAAAAGAPSADADEATAAALTSSGTYDYLFQPESGEPLRNNKVPRGLHLWFAFALGLLALALALAQGFLGHVQQPDKGARQAQPRELEASPPLSGLQREIARQRGGGTKAGIALEEPARASANRRRGPPSASESVGPLFGLAEAGESARSASALPANRRHVSLPASGAPSPELASPETALPEALLDDSELDDTRRYEQDKALSVIAGSHILAINHAPSVSGADPLAPDPLPSDTSLPAKMVQWLRASPELVRGAFGALKQVAPTPGSVSQGSVGRWAPNSTEAADAPEAALALGPFSTSAPARQSAPALYPKAAAARVLLLEGTPIPCVLLTEVRSDLPGMIVAQVSDDVFDSVRAELRLLPRGTRLIGRYDTQVAGGQQRLLASFHRLILPDASSIDLGRMDAADIAGSAGLQDEVDTHFWGRFGQAFLTAGLARAAQNPGGTVSINGVGGVLPGPDATGQILVDTARTSLQAGVQLAPTLIIRRGFPFQVMVNRDLVLEEAR